MSNNLTKHIYQKKDFVKKFFKFEISPHPKEIKFTSNILKNRMANELFYEIVPVILHEDDMNSLSYLAPMHPLPRGKKTMSVRNHAVGKLHCKT